MTVFSTFFTPVQRRFTKIGIAPLDGIGDDGQGNFFPSCWLSSPLPPRVTHLLPARRLIHPNRRPANREETQAGCPSGGARLALPLAGPTQHNRRGPGLAIQSGAPVQALRRASSGTAMSQFRHGDEPAQALLESSPSPASGQPRPSQVRAALSERQCPSGNVRAAASALPGAFAIRDEAPLDHGAHALGRVFERIAVE